MRVLETPKFRKQANRLGPTQNVDLDLAIRKVIFNPLIGVQKNGDLWWVRVTRGRLFGHVFLLAYEYRPEETIIVLHAIACYDDFSREPKLR